MIWECFRYVFLMIWECFLDDLGMFSGSFGDVFWMLWGCLLDVLGMFSGCFLDAFHKPSNTMKPIRARWRLFNYIFVSLYPILTLVILLILVDFYFGSRRHEVKFKAIMQYSTPCEGKIKEPHPYPKALSEKIMSKCNLVIKPSKIHPKSIWDIDSRRKFHVDFDSGVRLA